MPRYMDNYVATVEPRQHSNQIHQRAFDYNLGVVCYDDLGARIGMPVEHQCARREMRNSILANLALVEHAEPGNGLFYSRANDEYARHRRYAPASYTRRTIIRVIDELLTAGLIHETRTKPSRRATRRSVIWAQPTLNQKLAFLTLDDITYELREPILLRDDRRRLLNYQETKETRAMRREVVEQNEILSKLDIGLDAPNWRLTDAGLYCDTDGRIANKQKWRLYRVFNRGQWTLGGRYYGGWWQGLPKESRAQLTINGEAVYEYDISGCHLRMAFAMAGATLTESDPYQLDGLPRLLNTSKEVCRSLVKQAVLVLLNADNFRSALGAIRQNLADHRLSDPKAAKSIIAATKAAMPELSATWHSGIGLTLQRHDSEVATRVMRSLRKQGIPVLPVHDSFLVPIHAAQLLQATVNAEFELCLRRLGPR